MGAFFINVEAVWYINVEAVYSNLIACSISSIIRFSLKSILVFLFNKYRSTKSLLPGFSLLSSSVYPPRDGLRITSSSKLYVEANSSISVGALVLRHLSDKFIPPFKCMLLSGYNRCVGLFLDISCAKNGIDFVK